MAGYLFFYLGFGGFTVGLNLAAILSAPDADGWNWFGLICGVACVAIGTRAAVRGRP